MNFRFYFIMIAAGFMLAACQSNTYRINGSVEDAADGDTLFLTTDMQQGIPTDTMIIKDGRFELSGETDSVRFCMIYSTSREELNASFFLEPGRIQVKLTKDPGASRVGGTMVNDEWQRMNDSVMVVGKEINRIAEKIYETEATQEEQAKEMAKIEKLNQRFSNIVLTFAERNINNELGVFLLTFYPEEIIPNKERLRLIQQLPEKTRQREQIKQMEQLIGNAAKTEEGATIDNFNMPSIGGSPMSVMSEIKKNRITVLDFWASWCGPCCQEIPFMIDLYKRYKDKGLGIIGISLDEDESEWKQATEQLGIPWPQMSDLKGWDNMAARMFNITSIPHIIVLNQNGKILHRGLRGQALEDFIANQLK